MPPEVPLNKSDQGAVPSIVLGQVLRARPVRHARPPGAGARKASFNKGDYYPHSTGARHICVLSMFDELCCPVCAPPQQAPNIDLESRANLFIGTLRSTPAVTTRCYYSRGMMNPTSLSQRRFTLRPSSSSCKQAWRRK